MYSLSWDLIRSIAYFAFVSATLSTPSSNWTYRIPSKVQNGTAHARFEIDTSGGNLSLSSRQTLDAPHLNRINANSFDWWYFDAVDEDNPHTSLVVTFFTSSATAFPFLDRDEDSVLIAFVWASFANGSSWAGYLPSSLATVDIGGKGKQASLGIWEDTGFRWNALKEDLSAYEVILDAPELEVKGRLGLVAVSMYHFFVFVFFAANSNYLGSAVEITSSFTLWDSREYHIFTDCSSYRVG